METLNLENLPEPVQERLLWLAQLTRVAAMRSQCPRLAVGAILYRKDSVIGVAFNGAPRGIPHCKDVGCHVVEGHCVTSTHAEVNLIANCAKLGISTNEARIMVTHLPCHACAKAIIRANIHSVLYLTPYDNQDQGAALKLLKQAGVPVAILSERSTIS